MECYREGLGRQRKEIRKRINNALYSVYSPIRSGMGNNSIAFLVFTTLRIGILIA